jgi:hypothetical protein
MRALWLRDFKQKTVYMVCGFFHISVDPCASIGAVTAKSMCQDPWNTAFCGSGAYWRTKNGIREFPMFVAFWPKHGKFPLRGKHSMSAARLHLRSADLTFLEACAFRALSEDGGCTGEPLDFIICKRVVCVLSSIEK